jgi:hypothetical protein
MNINLNDSAFDAKEGKAIFNNGNAGIANDVTLSISKKKPEDKEGSPEYKVVFTDADGGSCNMSFWTVDKATQFATMEEQIQKQGKVLKHLLHAIYGKDFQLPQFQSAADMLNGCMKLVREGLPNAGKFRVFANYGTTSSVKQYVQPRSWVPFIETMATPLEATVLKAGTLDAMAKVEKDNFVASTSAGEASTTRVADDW